nr:immunoglobulin light chain junction region [Macaca mulatta]MOX51443.1 immunoglobulin light chain junction region [Macaca mulatta]MOX51450.1 immunoglobulin light chain junction region [Macaca mulatta]MOX51472.1 immunoglobulin light chain junction region [Macaca mulatta]MOX51546.1 immunoglobulin light chain junction region [Macaca mulatta]
CQQYNNWISF